MFSSQTPYLMHPRYISISLAASCFAYWVITTQVERLGCTRAISNGLPEPAPGVWVPLCTAGGAPRHWWHLPDQPGRWAGPQELLRLGAPPLRSAVQGPAEGAVTLSQPLPPPPLHPPPLLIPLCGLHPNLHYPPSPPLPLLPPPLARHVRRDRAEHHVKVATARMSFKSQLPLHGALLTVAARRRPPAGEGALPRSLLPPAWAGRCRGGELPAGASQQQGGHRALTLVKI